jgi:phosphorylcholine metabolism protein LicD
MNKVIFIIIFFIFFILSLFLFCKKPITIYESLETGEKTWLQTLSKKQLSDFKKGQTIMTNIFKEFDRICRKYNLKYWCSGGTIIGTIRHKGWLPWDGDIDVSMLDTDYIKLKEIIKNELPASMWFQDKTTDKYYKSNLGKIRYLYAYYCDDKSRKWHNGIQLDIFVFKKRGDILKAPYNGIYDIKDIKYNIIFPLKESYFENIKVFIPNHYDKYLRMGWGDNYIQPPPIQKQKCHEGLISFNIPLWMKLKYPKLYYV